MTTRFLSSSVVRALMATGLVFAVFLAGPTAQAAADCFEYPYLEKMDYYMVENTVPVGVVQYQAARTQYAVEQGVPKSEFLVQDPVMQHQYAIEYQDYYTQYAISYPTRKTQYNFRPRTGTDTLWRWNDYDTHINFFEHRGNGSRGDRSCRIAWNDPDPDCGGHSRAGYWYLGHTTTEHFQERWAPTRPYSQAYSIDTRGVYGPWQWGYSVPSNAYNDGNTRVETTWGAYSWVQPYPSGSRNYDFRWDGRTKRVNTGWSGISSWRGSIPATGVRNLDWRVTGERDQRVGWTNGTWKDSFPSSPARPNVDYRVTAQRVGYDYLPAVWQLELPAGTNGAEYRIEKTRKVFVDSDPVREIDSSSLSSLGTKDVDYRIVGSYTDYRTNGVFEPYSVQDARNAGFIDAAGNPVPQTDFSKGVFSPLLISDSFPPVTAEHQKYVKYYYVGADGSSILKPPGSQFQSVYGTSGASAGQMDRRSVECQVVRPT